MLSGLRSIDLIEPVEDLVQLIRRDANAGVGDGYGDPLPLDPAFPSKADRILSSESEF